MARQLPHSLAERLILVVEDEYIVAMDLAQSLEELGAIIVGPAGSVEGALALVMAGTPIDAALLDVNLGREWVYPVADVLQARGVPYVFATGYEKWIIPVSHRDAPWCEKPVNIAHLARILASLPVTSRTA